MIWTFIILSPVISIVQTDRSAHIVAHGKHLAHAIATGAAVQVATVVHTIQALLA
jgi:hypothetical protein